MILHKKGGKVKYSFVPAQQDATRVEQSIKMVTGKPTGDPVEMGLAKGVFSMNDEKMMGLLNKVIPNRFSIDKAKQYDQYDKDILEAVKELKAQGEEVNPNLIKTIMLIETGMEPRRNELGYEGFAQTKPYITEYINKRYGTKFSIEDMYDPKDAAKFIHFMSKDIGKSMYVNTVEDTVAAYNWGVGNYARYNRGEAEMPKETENYMKLATIMSSISK